MEIEIDAILPELAKKPLTESQIDMVARGLLIPSPGLAQRFGIELRAARSVEAKPEPDGYVCGLTDAIAITEEWIHSISCKAGGPCDHQRTADGIRTRLQGLIEDRAKAAQSVEHKG